MKRIRVMLGWLVAGAIVNVAVVCGIAYCNPEGSFIERGIDRYGSYNELGVFWSVRNYQALGSFRCQSHWLNGFVNLFDDPKRTPLEVLPPWALYAIPDKDSKLNATRTVVAYGWPWLAMWGGYEADEKGDRLLFRR